MSKIINKKLNFFFSNTNYFLYNSYIINKFLSVLLKKGKKYKIFNKFIKNLKQIRLDFLLYNLSFSLNFKKLKPFFQLVKKLKEIYIKLDKYYFNSFNRKKQFASVIYSVNINKWVWKKIRFLTQYYEKQYFILLEDNYISKKVIFRPKLLFNLFFSRINYLVGIKKKFRSKRVTLIPYVLSLQNQISWSFLKLKPLFKVKFNKTFRNEFNLLFLKPKLSLILKQKIKFFEEVKGLIVFRHFRW